jgi:ribosomal protein S18 acetylase RimI-like enzyme
MTNIHIEATTSEDLPALAAAADETGLFPREMLPDMVAGFLAGDAESLWLTASVDEAPVGFCYTAAEMLTQGTWNMLALAVRPTHQGHGVGAALVAELEARLRQRDVRVVIADTSGTDAFARTRTFYVQNGYTEEARIRDFWDAGDDKVIFWKRLD